MVFFVRLGWGFGLVFVIRIVAFVVFICFYSSSKLLVS